MSKTMVVAPIIGALVGAEDILGKDRNWNAVNDPQSYFLENYFSTRAELARFSEKELRHWTSWVAAELNKILKEEGFDIQLDDFEPDTFGVVSILDVLVEWLVKGAEDRLLVGGTNYPAVRMEPFAEVDGEFKTVFEVFTSREHMDPIALLHTKSGDKLYITVADRAYESFELAARIDEIRNNLTRAGHYDWLKFPMVDLNQQVPIDWLIGMRTTVDTTGQQATISQALQQTKFKMNQFGAGVKSVVVIGPRLLGSSTSTKQGLEINRPFFLWIERQGVSVPVMYSYLDEENWKGSRRSFKYVI